MLQHFLFIFQIFSIFTVETFKYYLFGTNIIKNLAYKLAKVNILCVKLFQAISLNINKSINDELIKYTDQVPYSIEYDIDFDNIMNLVSQEGLYIDINKPIASGMISIVYKALVQKTGEYKIIKMKRKNIEQKLEESIDNLKMTELDPTNKEILDALQKPYPDKDAKLESAIKNDLLSSINGINLDSVKIIIG